MVPSISGLAAIAFDLDDTLYDREAAVRRLLLQWLGPIPSGTLNKILEYDGRGHTPREPFFQWVADCYSRLGSDGAGLWERFRHELPSHMETDPHIETLLHQIKTSGLTAAILTNGLTSYQMAKFHATGLVQRFAPQHVLTSEAVGAEKPAPEAFAALADALGLPPGRILFVGDHAVKDIAGAKAAGFLTCWLRRRDPDGICLEADLVIDSLATLMPLLLSAG